MGEGENKVSGRQNARPIIIYRIYAAGSHTSYVTSGSYPPVSHPQPSDGTNQSANNHKPTVMLSLLCFKPGVHFLFGFLKYFLPHLPIIFCKEIHHPNIGHPGNPTEDLP